ncbi:MAG: dicarboxylate/amino acid:cation symporter [Caulobacteraceae bacterium]
MRALRLLYVQVLIGIALGIVVGAIWPHFGESLKPLGDAFVKLIKMLIAPVIFTTVAVGIAQMSDLKSFGRIGGKTLLYFEVVSTFALVLGLVVGELVRPGAGFNIDPATLDPKLVAEYATRAHDTTVVKFLMDLIPDTFVGALSGGNILQVLVVAILTGLALTRMGELGERLTDGLHKVSELFFGVIRVVVRLAPIGAFGAMAFTIGKYGLAALLKLLALVATFYGTSLLFVVVVLGAICFLTGFNIFRFLNYIREELLIVLGASSSEAALPQLMEKLERLGAPRSVVSLVVPTGYSFNLDGTNIYMTLATLFIAQATNTPLTLQQELMILVVAMLTSKGASGVTGAGFVTLAATLQVVPAIPLVGLAIILGVDRFMSECRALTNIIGNGVATLVISRWEGTLDRAKLAEELRRGPTPVTAPPALGSPAD